ncbi:MAG: UDP-N-acetylmuramoyl-tripeptide--D-alanyl-D-alanine ligase [Armatimonadetes bacterium]|nr:UDP-N-acetylmuramoyl-tripeptide--D-alanyl-D-alanine ligase [Armatimonadota bacterium]
MNHSLADIARRCGGQLVGDDMTLTGFATDNREIKPRNLFIAIKGERVDGHDFVPSALAAGAVAVLCERPIHGRYILVPNVVEALAKMARSFRAEFHGPVIGITGSAGKTTTKEFAASACACLGSVLKTQGNRNSEFTGPLLWPELTPETKVVVTEMGMRGFGQIAHLASFNQPTIGVVTNVGYSHLESVGSREGIATAKAEMLAALSPDGVAVLFSEDEYLGNLISVAGNRRIRTFGFGGNADCQVTSYEALNWTSAKVEGVLDGKKWSLTMPTVGRHLATNVAAALLAAVEAGAEIEAACRGIETATLPPLRMEIRDFQGATLVMDNYNSNPPAVLAALQALEEVPSAGKRVAVLGTMRELGLESEEGHRSIGRRLSQSKVDQIFVFGDETEFIEQEYLKRGGDSGRFERLSSLDELKSKLSWAGPGDTILVKGSRALEMEKAF